jgi:hypothetical protein
MEQGSENAPIDFYRKMDALHPVFASGEASPAWELRRHLGNISQRMLTRTLRNLESTGLSARRVTRSKPLAVEYFAEQTWKDNHQAAQWYVPVGEVAPYGCERRRAPRRRG